MSKKNTHRPGGEIVVYQAEDGGNRIRVLLENETVWLTQVQMARLFQTSVPNIHIHINHTLEEGELTEGATIKDYSIVRSEGSREVKRSFKHYNLDMILRDTVDAELIKLYGEGSSSKRDASYVPFWA